MRQGLIIIGDEVLSGKRQDRHFAHVVGALAARGMELSWCRIIGDAPDLIVDTLRQTLAHEELVFCFGGIGATPDDHTRACAARAVGVELQTHPEAVAEMEARFGPGLSPARTELARLPARSRIIPNPYNRVPGFSLAHHHFLPGFPEMAWPMLDWVLDKQYRHLRREEADIERILLVQAKEGELLALMQAFVRDCPGCRFSCLPNLGEPPSLELGVRGARGDVEAGLRYLQEALTASRHVWHEKRTESRPRRET